MDSCIFIFFAEIDSLDYFLWRLISNLLNTGRKLNVDKTFRRQSGRLLNILCTFNSRSEPGGGGGGWGVGEGNILVSCVPLIFALCFQKKTDRYSKL